MRDWSHSPALAYQVKWQHKKPWLESGTAWCQLPTARPSSGKPSHQQLSLGSVLQDLYIVSAQSYISSALCSFKSVLTS